MAIKQRSVYKKQEFEYTSPDGDKWEIIYIEHENRKYVRIGREGEDASTCKNYDLEMLFDINDNLREITSQARNKPISSHGLKKPQIVDHRQTSQAPVEAFSTDKGLTEVRSGVNIDQMAPVSETPESWATSNKDAEDLLPWQKDAINRKAMKPPVYNPRGSAGRGFQRKGTRVGASDLI